MADDHDPEDKTEDASERRIEQALEKGDVPRSQELQSFMTLLAGGAALVVTLHAAGPTVLNRLAGSLARSHAVSLDAPGPPIALPDLITTALALAGPLLAIMVAGVLASMMMHRPMLVTDPLLPKPSRISPMAGLKRLFGKENAIQFGKTLFKLTLVLGLMGNMLWDERARLVRLVQMPDLWQILAEAARLTARLTAIVLVVQAFLAVADAVYQHFAWKKRLRMSLHEVKQEHKETDGNPEIKAKLKQIRQQRMRQRMMTAVPKAAVVIVNPTHYAVALAYDAGMAAPRCVAKGVDELALKIREVAEEHRVPIIENPPLARALHASVEVDADIPPDHYKAVAEVIGYVLRLRRPRR